MWLPQPRPLYYTYARHLDVGTRAQPAGYRGWGGRSSAAKERSANRRMTIPMAASETPGTPHWRRRKASDLSSWPSSTSPGCRWTAPHRRRSRPLEPGFSWALSHGGVRRLLQRVGQAVLDSLVSCPQGRVRGDSDSRADGGGRRCWVWCGIYGISTSVQSRYFLVGKKNAEYRGLGVRDSQPPRLVPPGVTIRRSTPKFQHHHLINAYPSRKPPKPCPPVAAKRTVVFSRPIDSVESVRLFQSQKYANSTPPTNSRPS